ncbi:hypothetical protein GOP47_0007292 [Adiantum capillus-veneris]|uniref:Phospholipid-transporting ATPase n=1 Tax=Adiantum capillus-veneris TaxID=13818 RepID=A0A9D4ZJ31_ADICA|nr:hypothetical protein GOP47_0007292 [Adiantum capillus-veneris]
MSLIGQHLLASGAPSLSSPHQTSSPASPAANGGFSCLCINALPIALDDRPYSLHNSHPLAATVGHRCPPSAADDFISESVTVASLGEAEKEMVMRRISSHSRASKSNSLSQLDVSVPALERFRPEVAHPAVELLEPWDTEFLSKGLQALPALPVADASCSVLQNEEVHKSKPRRVFINNPLRTNDRGDLVGNKVRTSKYTWLTFLPKNLFEQFRRVAYIYFLAIVILNQIPQLAVFGRTASLFPLLFVLVVTAIKDGYEDWGRHRSDVIENNRLAQVFTQGEFRPKKWKQIEVGEVVKVDANTPVPCDMVLLGTSDPTGVAYIQTLNLDGESNLKTRYARQETQVKQPDIHPLSGCVVCEPPTRNIYEFTAFLELDSGKFSLGPSNVILRGCELKNTAWIVGVVVYAGKDTKVMKNSAGAQSKRSKLESRMNSATMWLAFFLLLICLVGGLGMGIWVGKHQKILNVLPYYGKTDISTGEDVEFYNVVGEAVFAFLSFVIMFQVMIPISLYISMELVRLGQSSFMSRDKEMYCSGSDTRFECRALNINEDLGQIKYIFSDKTGTLTQNKMEFYTASIDGVNYVDGVKDFSSSDSSLDQIRRSGGAGPMPEQLVKVDLKLLHLLQSGVESLEKKVVQDFFLVLAVCNTVVPIKVEEETSLAFDNSGTDQSPGKSIFIDYQAESPDEQALVTAAASYGYVLLERSSMHVLVGVQGVVQRYDLLGFHEFDSVRKRMSVVVRCPDRSIKVFMKGADTTVLDLVTKHTLFTATSAAERHSANVFTSTVSHLDEYAKTGLRTLVIAFKDLSEADYYEWESQFSNASTALGNNRVVLLRKVAESLERDLILLGATGVEDKLQDGVPETIAALRAAGMKVWVLTGDKQETAISIGFACNLLTHDMEQIIINANTASACRDAIFRAKEGIQNLKAISVQRCNGKHFESPQSSPLSSTAMLSTASTTHLHADGGKLQEPNGLHGENSPPLALIIDGNSLLHALAKDMEQELFELATACQAVICCRVAPSQKSNIVSLVKDKAQEMTLAIGDGANDVPMLQKAHVGIGLSGQEGRQAVMSSDFSMGQFRFLSKLLLVHGHWNYQRLSYMVLYNFYRNAVFVMMLFWFILQTAFSASSAIFDWNLMFYSLIYTSVPTVVVGIFDKDISQKTLLENPPLYGAGQRDENYNSLLFWITMLDTLWQSLVLFYVPLYTYQVSTIDIWSIGSLWTVAVVILVNLHLAMDVQHWTWITHLAIWGSIASTFGCLFILDSITVESFLPHYRVIHKMIRTFGYWYDIVLIVILALLPRFFVKVVVQRVWPCDIQIAREVETMNNVKGSDLNHPHAEFG